MFLVNEVQSSDPTRDELVLNANVRIVGEIRQGETDGAPTIQTALALKAEKEGVKAVMRGTPDPAWLLYRVPFATGHSVRTGGGGGSALSTDSYNELDLQNPR